MAPLALTRAAYALLPLAGIAIAVVIGHETLLRGTVVRHSPSSLSPSLCPLTPSLLPSLMCARSPLAGGRIRETTSIMQRARAREAAV